MYCIIRLKKESQITNIDSQLSSLNSTIFNLNHSQTKFERKIENNSKKFNQVLADMNSNMEKIQNKNVEMSSDLSDFKSSQTLFEDEVQDKYDMFNQSLSDLEFEIMEKLESIRDEMAKNSSETLFVEEYNNEMFNRSQNAP